MENIKYIRRNVCLCIWGVRIVDVRTKEHRWLVWGCALCTCKKWRLSLLTIELGGAKMLRLVMLWVWTQPQHKPTRSKQNIHIRFSMAHREHPIQAGATRSHVVWMSPPPIVSVWAINRANFWLVSLRSYSDGILRFARGRRDDLLFYTSLIRAVDCESAKEWAWTSYMSFYVMTNVYNTKTTCEKQIFAMVWWCLCCAFPMLALM